LREGPSPGETPPYGDERIEFDLNDEVKIHSGKCSDVL
jgi:hypothetical protein